MKKRKFSICLSIVLALSMTACTKQAPKESIPDSTPKPETITQNSNVLIAYFSRWGNTDNQEDIDVSTSASIMEIQGEKTGTTEAMADRIQEITGGDKVLIQSEEAYDADFDKVRERAHEEQDQNRKPKLTTVIDDMDQYDVIFLGYPVWASSIPAPVASFLSAYDLSDKMIIPFCTHDGYGAGTSYTDIKKLAEQSNVKDGLAIEASKVSEAQSQVEEWLNGLGFSQKSDASSVSITIGDQTLEGVLYDTEVAEKVKAMMPLTVTMGRYYDREYYGSLPETMDTQEEGQRTFEDGHITYCPQNNTIAIFFAQTDRPDLGMSVIPIGKITSSLELFQDLDASVEMVFSIS